MKRGARAATAGLGVFAAMISASAPASAAGWELWPLEALAAIYDLTIAFPGPSRYFEIWGGARATTSATPRSTGTLGTAGLHFATHFENIGQKGQVTTALLSDLAIGGGSQGTEGALAMRATRGLGTPVGEQGQLFARAGLSMHLDAARVTTAWAFTLPEIELGYQHASERRFFEIGPRLGLVLAGNVAAIDAPSRSLGVAFGPGGFVKVGQGSFHAFVDAFSAVAPGRAPMVSSRLGLCGALGDRTIFILCADGRLLATRVPRGAGDAEFRSARVGFTMALGFLDSDE